jgi:hypothetical protein
VLFFARKYYAPTSQKQNYEGEKKRNGSITYTEIARRKTKYVKG